jgi:glycosyltransferase involved in cell wall biosynthesis
VKRVTVVIPCFNASGYIESCLDSLRTQTMTEWSAIVVDDRSTDGSVSIIRRWAKQDPRIRFVMQEINGGVASARNRGASQADTDYILFLDADDCLLPRMLEQTVGYLDDNPNVSAVYTGHSYMDHLGRDQGPETGEWPWCRQVATRWWMRTLEPAVAATPFASIYLVAAIIPSLALIRVSAYAATPGWDEDFGQGCEDTDLFLWLALRGSIHHLPTRLVRYRRHEAQHSRHHDFARQYRRLHEKWLGLPGLEPAEQRVVRDAEWFRRARVVPAHQLRAARQSLRRGQRWQAVRHLKAGVVNYSPRRPPTSTMH